MIVKSNKQFKSNMRKFSLNILVAGYGEMDREWSGNLSNIPMSKLFFIVEGEFYINTSDGKKIDFKEGNAYLIPSGSTYSFGCNGPIRHLFFNLQLCTFDKIDVLGEIGDIVSMPIDYPGGMDRLVELAMSESCDDTLKMEQEIRRALILFLEKEGIGLSKAEYSPEIHRAIEYITENLSIKLEIAEIANNVHLASSTLTRRFRRETGMSIGEYIDKQILFRAERELVSTDASVLEISEKYGFCDQFYFSRKFKAAYGTAPSVHRRKINV